MIPQIPLAPLWARDLIVRLNREFRDLQASSEETGTQSIGGFSDQNNSGGAVSLSANTWLDLPNDGAGAFSNTDYLPANVTTLMDNSTGYIDPRELNLGDAILIRNDFTITPTINNALLEFQYSLGSGANTYTLPKTPFRLSAGAGVADRIVSSTDYIYMGDTNTRDNFIKIQIRCTAAATVNNAGSVMQVLRGG